jgi:hypothetical protein
MISKGTKGAQRITRYHKAIPKLYPSIPFPNHTLYYREDPRPPVTTTSTIMIVVHFAKVSALYPRVVISSLIGRLENLLFAILTLPLVYGPEITVCHHKRLLWVVCQALLR